MEASGIALNRAAQLCDELPPGKLVRDIERAFIAARRGTLDNVSYSTAINCSSSAVRV